MALDPGWAAISGAAVGAAIAVSGNAAISWTSGRKERSLAEKRRARLRRMLNGTKFKWRNLKKLSASIGADDATTMQLLIEIDARASLQDPQMWALVSRAPWPEDYQPQD